MSGTKEQRQYYERMMDEYRKLIADHKAEREVKRLQAENEKLRELVRDIADHVNHGDGFGIDRGWMLDRMRELGVEVDV